MANVDFDHNGHPLCDGFTPQGDGTIKAHFRAFDNTWIVNTYRVEEFPEFVKYWEADPLAIRGENMLQEAKLAYQMELEA